MKLFQVNLKRVGIALFLFFSTCSSTCKQQWMIEKVITDSPCFNSGKLTLSPTDTFCGLELELTRGESGVRMYINVFSLEIKPEHSMQSTALVEVTYQNQKQTFHAFLYQGGQRLLLPNQARDLIIESLSQNEPVCIAVGRYRSEISPEDFTCKYDALLSLPIN
jgi:hypothetical protein